VFRKKSIDEWALDYWLLQQYARLCFRIYYKKIWVVNLHNIPKNQPVIIAPNHQNALMDAMLFVSVTKSQIVFLARADIFKGKLLIRLLTYLNIMPIYRLRDGIENVKRNDEVFAKTARVLRNKFNPLCIFPEGNHGDRRRLRNLVKGIFRIALGAQEEYGEKLGVKIVPVGIDYGHYQNFRTTLLVNVGQPIEISEYSRLCRENPVQALNQLKERFAAEVSKLMINIRSEEYYETYMGLRIIYNAEMRKRMSISGNSPEARFRADKAMIGMLDRELESSPEFINRLDNLVSDYSHRVKKAHLRDWVLSRDRYSVPVLCMDTLIRIILLPVFILGYISNYVPYRFTETRTRNIKDPQFHSSIKYVTGMVVFPTWYLVMAIGICFIPAAAWIKWTFMLLMPLTGLPAFHYYIGAKKLLSRIRYTLGVIRKRPEIHRMKELRKDIVGMMRDLVNRQIVSHESSR